MYVFFCDSNDDHRYLHSFPTRRSSDLNIINGVERPVKAAELFAFTLRVREQFSGFNRDRKSGSAGMPRPISYAVFCLKKKNHTYSTYFLTHVIIYVS